MLEAEYHCVKPLSPSCPLLGCSSQTMTEAPIKIYHHPNKEIESFLTKESLFPPRVEFLKNPLSENENERLQQLGAIASQIVRDIMALPGVREIRVKPKEVRMKKEEYASWNEIEPKVCQILNRALQRKGIKMVKG